MLRKKQDTKGKPSDMATKGNQACEVVTKADLEKLTNTIMRRFDGLDANVATIRKDINELRNGLEDLKVTTIDSSARISELEKSIPELKKEREKVEKELRGAILAMEVHNRKQNLLVYGVEKEAGENSQKKVRELIEMLGISREVASNMALVNTHRLPRKHAGQGERRGPDPLIVRFGSMYDRDLVLQHYQQKQRQQTAAARENQEEAQNRLPFRILIDLPPILKQRRFELEKSAYTLRKEENQSTRIRLVGIEVILEKREKGSSSAWARVVE